MTARRQRRTVPAIVRAVRELCAREQLFPAGSRALVLVSGGQDSTALLEMLAGGLLRADGPAEVLALHVNHHLRGKESDDDEELVGENCIRLDVELEVVHRPVEKGGGNVQERARSARREAALAAAAARQCDRIALGHTADDQVETMLYRMGRYGGLAALRGMLPFDLPWVRPLLGLRRGETEAFCRERGLEFAVDSGNTYPRYARTGVRTELLPAWEAILPGAVEAAGRTAEVVAEAESLFASVIDSLGVDLDSPGLEANRLQGLAVPLRRLLLHEWLERREECESTRRHVLAIEGLLEKSGSASLDLGSGWRVVKEYDQLSLGRSAGGGRRGKGAATQVTPEVELPLPGNVGWAGRRIRAERVDRFCAPDPVREAYVDATVVRGPLYVRGVRPGDRVRPLGMDGTRKLQDVLVDLHVPAERRALVPLVVCGGVVLWVCGLLSAEQGRITEKTRELVRFSIE